LPRKPDPRNAIILEDDEMTRLLNEAGKNPMLWFYVMVLSETGLRADSEALKLEWTDFDLTRGFLRVKSAPTRRTKSGKSRDVALSDTLRAAFEAHKERYGATIYPGVGRSPFVFHIRFSTPKKVAGHRVRSFRNLFDRAAAAAKLPVGFVGTICGTAMSRSCLRRGTPSHTYRKSWAMRPSRRRRATKRRCV